MSDGFTPTQESNLRLIRAGLCTALALGVFAPGLFQPALDKLWSFLLCVPLYNVSAQYQTR